MEETGKQDVPNGVDILANLGRVGTLQLAQLGRSLNSEEDLVATGVDDLRGRGERNKDKTRNNKAGDALRSGNEETVETPRARQ